jgi:hypothetical protein
MLDYPHGSMQRTSNLVVLLQPGAATQNLRKPELANGTLHVTDLALSRGGSLDPLRGLTANTAYHVSMGEGLGRPLLGLHVESRGNRLSNPRVERRGPAGDNEAGVTLIASARTTLAITRPRTGEGWVGSERRRHGLPKDKRPTKVNSRTRIGRVDVGSWCRFQETE